MEGKRRSEKDMQDSLVVDKAGKIVKFPCFKILSSKKKLNNGIVEIHKDPTS